MVLVQNWPFHPSFYFRKYILERENAFQGEKIKKLKETKIEIFLKGLVHGFGPKVAVFPSFDFRQRRPKKCFLRYSRTDNRLSKLSNQEFNFKKSKT